MEKKQRNDMLVLAGMVIVYLVGAACGFPFVQSRFMTGNIGRVIKQQEQQNSPSDVKMAEKYEADSAYRNRLTSGFAVIYVQTKTTVSTLAKLKQTSAPIVELKSYMPRVDEAMETGKNLETLLNSIIDGLKNLKEKKPINDLSMTMSQSLNIFQILNSRLVELDGMVLKVAELAKQKKLNDEVIKIYAQYAIETSNIAATCGESDRVNQCLGFFYNSQTRLSASVLQTEVESQYKALYNQFAPVIGSPEVGRIAMPLILDQTMKQGAPEFLVTLL